MVHMHRHRAPALLCRMSFRGASCLASAGARGRQPGWFCLYDMLGDGDLGGGAIYIAPGPWALWAILKPLPSSAGAGRLGVGNPHSGPVAPPVETQAGASGAASWSTKPARDIQRHRTD
jgi:hypothetical protein